MRIAHLSDFHVANKPDRKINGVNPLANLQKAVGAVRAQNPKVDLIILGGDLFEEGEKASYQLIAEQFKDFQVPIHTVLGNHDQLAAFRKTSLPQRPDDFTGYYSFDHNKLHVVILNTVIPGKPSGRLDEQQLLWLSEDLFHSRAKPVLIFMHHPPLDSGVAWLDKLKLHNAESFWEVVPPYSRNILGVFAGHTHIQTSYLHRGVLVCVAPATSWNFLPRADAARAEFSDEQPGFNLIDVAEQFLRVRAMRFPVTEAAEPVEAGRPEGELWSQGAEATPGGPEGTGQGALPGS
jgi:Icc protein